MGKFYKIQVLDLQFTKPACHRIHWLFHFPLKDNEPTRIGELVGDQETR
jgi:hypothetical protein